MFAIFLFIVYYSFLIWLFDEHKPSDYSLQTVPDSQEKNSTTTTGNQIFPEDVFALLDDSSTLEIFIKNLKLRPARKLARQLKIAQKVNGKDKCLAQFRREIRQKLRSAPELLPEAQTITAA